MIWNVLRRRCLGRRLVMSRFLPEISGTCPGGRASLRDGPRLATRQVKGRHRILAIRAPLTLRALA
jgi:hypothetical protein